MGRADICCVNLSGKTHNVYDLDGKVIGALEKREFFTYIGGEGSLSAIYFLSPSGPKTGYLRDASGAVFTDVSTRPHSTLKLGGKNYKVFIMRKTMNLYDVGGNVVGSVAAGKRVLCQSGQAGETMHYLKRIDYAEKRAGGWDPMAGGGADYGFVDTGLRTSSSASGIAFYGNW